MKAFVPLARRVIHFLTGTRALRTSPAADPLEAEKLVAEIDQTIRVDPDMYLNQTSGLLDADFELMGRFVQTYCFADLNARRMIDAVKHASKGSEKRNAGRLQDKQVFEELEKAIAMLPAGTLRDGLMRGATTIGMHYGLRHIFAHWGGRRVKGQDALILFTKNTREAEKKSGLTGAPDELTWVVIPLAALRSEMIKLESHSQFLAASAARFEAEHQGWKAHFETEREVERLARYEAGKLRSGAKGKPP